MLNKLKSYFFKQKVSTTRPFISKKLDFEIRKTKQLLESRYRKAFGKSRKLTYQSSSEAVADRIRELRYNGKW